MLCLRNKEKVQEELTKALEVLIENDVDMILVEYFFYIQEMEWAIELCRKVKIRYSLCQAPTIGQPKDLLERSDRAISKKEL